MAEPILREGENCWRLAQAGRAAVLIDAARYFEALADAIERAERRIVMLGWDFHSRVALRRGDAVADRSGEEARSHELLALLERRVRQRRSLHVYILAWDFSMIYAMEREWQPLFRFDWATHRRITFRLDAAHPVGASQHQKIVVVDDALAFSGGLDVTVCRWDTPEHLPEDTRRSDPGCESYGPFHDVQMAVDGDAARALAELASERWKLATGRTLRPVRGRKALDPWPRDLVPEFQNVAVAVSRTFPAHAGRSEVREIERLHVDALRAAERSVYLENQYFTADAIADAIEERLAEDEGPEVVVVLPSSLSGWLEEQTMGALAAKLVRRLRAADVHGRLRVLQPRLPDGGTLCVHAKVAVIDDRLLRVGSANTSNRSMGFDSECDLALESTPEHDVSREIRAVRERLLAEHLGCTPEEVAAATERTGSLIAAIDALGTGERRLDPVPQPEPGWIAEVLSDSRPFDPEQPLGVEELWGRFTTGHESEASHAGGVMTGVRAGLGVLVVAALLLTWYVTPLGDSLDPAALAGHAASLGDDWLGVLAAVGLFAVAATLLVPVTLLVSACGMVFGVAKGAGIGLAGSLLGAAVGYGAGRILWRDTVRRMAGRRLDRINRMLARRGLLAAITLRLVPIAPFGVVNVVVGATHLGARDFLLGTLLGMTPGTVALAFFGDRALAALRNPGWETATFAVLLLAGIFAIGKLVERRFARHASAPGSSPR